MNWKGFGEKQSQPNNQCTIPTFKLLYNDYSIMIFSHQSMMKLRLSEAVIDISLKCMESLIEAVKTE
jgi:hypothetical protein